MESITLYPAFSSIGSILIGLWILSAIRKSSRLSLPPGPRRLPIVGNLFQMPSVNHYLKFTEWRKIYGALVYLEVFGSPVLVLNDLKEAKELLDNRGAMYSDRPRFVMAGDLIGWDKTPVLSPFNKNLRYMRRLMALTIQGKYLEAFRPKIENACRSFVIQFLDEPENLIKQLKRLNGTVVLDVVYGHEVTSNDDALVAASEKSVEDFGAAITMGVHAVDFIPALKSLPTWFPFFKFHSIAQRQRSNLYNATNKPVEIVKRQIAEGTARDSFVAKHLQETELDDWEMEMLKRAAQNMYGGGVDTTTSVLTNFFFYMTLHPEIQLRAQEEIDQVTSGERLPDIRDRDKLPYVNAIFLETLRLGPSVPTGLPHRLVEDDEYKGYRIPANTVVYANIWDMTHNDAEYPNPDVFLPDRYLDPQNPQTDPRSMIFGFGRRICPGKDLADEISLLTIAMTLATCDIRAKVDGEGRYIMPTPDFAPGLICQLRQWEYTVSPRSEKHLALIQSYA
ncbi:cytochrome P450 [Sistotremastrum niveocremeum HHB9708]|uniref:Cytochrome P450 n=2 Tax=Sistotremastraceae TaxID=3402574 RepID=A0A164Q1E8_9AGAM|nr:cytochrome P450 [Sistotremastrum niveocremeum HHB9708]KZT35835.1 cytochrome P450 [Sistotremastrum suecicum HHB10207 ss-3]